ncbi:phage portal protein [Planctomycetes bacterium TBK1r]|uniref:Phage portal protein, lambda family n=1 Tax=Stieleria magnilauensis TaxID=2527963 RepID=A0ABX5XVN2_9BACT|nr:Phage portal protein, lambda family [Planctomycetes bacterium TBK1r]
MIALNGSKRHRRPGDRKAGSRLERVAYAIDEAIFTVAPTWGERRIASRLKRRLLAEQATRMKGFGRRSRHAHPSVRSAPHRDGRWFNDHSGINDQLEESQQEMQFRARELYQSNPHAHGAIEGRVSHEIGVGLGCRPQITESKILDKEQADLANKTLKRICKRWSNRGVDRARRQSLDEAQRLICRTYAMFGEAFVLFRDAPFQGPIGLTVEVIDPMRVETPPDYRDDENVRMGIRYHAKTDQIVGYYIRKQVQNGKRYDVEYEFVRRYNSAGQEQVVHLFESMFPGQKRGIPWLCAAFAFLKDLDDFHEAELIGKQIEACFGIVIKTGKRGGTPAEISAGMASGEFDEQGNPFEEIFPGMVERINSDDDLVKVDPSRPGSTFAPFVEASLRAIAAALNYPYELLAKNFFRTTYSSGRLAMLDGRIGFRMRAQAMIHQVLKPLWRRIVDDAFFYGHMDDVTDVLTYTRHPEEFHDHSWGGTSFGAVDPEKEVSAHEVAINSDQETLSEVYADKDQDWLEGMQQRDVELREKIRLEIAREKWEVEERERAGLPIKQRDGSGEVGEGEKTGGVAA